MSGEESAVRQNFRQLEKINQNLEKGFGIGVTTGPIPAFSHTPTTDLSISRGRNDLSVQKEGATLLSVGIRVLSGIPNRNVYVRVILESSLLFEKAILFKGYVGNEVEPFGNGGLVLEPGDNIRIDSHSGMAVAPILEIFGTMLLGRSLPGGWAGTDEDSTSGQGSIRSITGTDPAAGVEVSETIRTNSRSSMETFAVQVVGGAAAFTPRWTIGDGTENLWRLTYPQVDAAATRKYFAGLGIALLEVQTLGPFNDAHQALPDMLWDQGYVIATSSISADDNYAAPQFQLQEWLRVE